MLLFAVLLAAEFPCPTLPSSSLHLYPFISGRCLLSALPGSEALIHRVRGGKRDAWGYTGAGGLTGLVMTVPIGVDRRDRGTCDVFAQY